MRHASDRSTPYGRRHMIWVAAAVVALAFLAYFLFFTGTPDRATLTEDALDPATTGEKPAT